MKKQLFNFVGLSFCMGSFGFWELEGPFIQKLVNGQMVNQGKKLINPINHVDVTQKKEEYNALYNQFYAEVLAYFQGYLNNKSGYICLYNRQTGYSIGCMYLLSYKNMFDKDRFFKNFPKPSVKQVYDNNGINWDNAKSTLFDFNHIDEWSGFYFVKENPCLNLNGSLNPIFSTQLYIQEKIKLDERELRRNRLFNIRRDHNTERNSINLFGAKKSWQKISPLSNQIKSISGLIVTNEKEGKVKIQQDISWKSWFMSYCGNQPKVDNPVLDFQVQLEKYFDKDSKNREFAENLKNSLQTDEGLSARKLNALKFASRVGEEEMKRLNNSKIVAVYGLMKNDRGQEGIIWGLAEDTTSPEKRRFHWITDLEDNISCLLRQ